MSMLFSIPRSLVPWRLLLTAIPIAAHGAGSIDFEHPVYVTGGFAKTTPGVVDKNFNGQDGWSESASDSPGHIVTTLPSGEYPGGQGLVAAGAGTYIGAKSGYHLLQGGGDTFTFEVQIGASQAAVGFWADTDGDGLFDRDESQIQFGVHGNSGEFGYRRPGFAPVVPGIVLSGANGIVGNWHRISVTVGEPDEMTGERQIVMQARDLTASQEVDFDPDTPGIQPWLFTVTSADFGVEPDEWSGTFVRVTSGAIDNINRPLSPPANQAIWSGGGGNGNWSTAANWAGNTPPVAGDALIFAGFDELLSTNNLAPGLAVSGLTFDATAENFALIGSGIELTGSLRNESSFDQVIELPVSLPGNLTVIAASGPLYLDGAVSGPGGFTKSGAGLFLLAGANTYSGGLSVAGGAVDLEGDQSAADGGFRISNAGNASINIIHDAQAASRVDAEIRLGEGEGGGATGTATLNVRGSLDSAGKLSLLRGSRLNISGAVNQSGPVTVAGIGGYPAQMEISSGGTFSYTGGEPIVMRSGSNNNGRGSIIVNGGEFVTGAGFVFDSGSSFAGNLSLRQGGTLRLSAPVPELTTETAPIAVTLDSGTGVIDTNGHDAAIPTPVSGSGSLVKSGSGKLRLGRPGHTGDTLVTGGILGIGAPTLDQAATVDVLEGAMLHIDFAGENRVGRLVLGGETMDFGVYRAGDHELLGGSGGGSIRVGVPGAARITYVDASEENTTLADGTPYSPTVSDPDAGVINNHWDLRGFGNGGGAYESNGAPSSQTTREDAPRIRTTLELVPGENYDIYAYFWGASDARWRGLVSLEDSPGGLQGYVTNVPEGSGHLPMQGLAPNAVVGSGPASLNLPVQGGFEQGGHFTNSVRIAEANRTLFQIRLGTATADQNGHIHVYIDDHPNQAGANRTVYDGVGYRVVPDQSGFAGWAWNLGLSGDPGDDADGDGLPDAVEYVLGTDPHASTPSGIAAGASGDDFVFTFDRDRNSKTEDVSLAVEIGSDLQSWPTVLAVGGANDPAVPEIDVRDNGDGTETITATVPRNGAPRLFARLRVTILGAL